MEQTNALKFIRTRIFKATQSDFASICGVRQSTVSRWESGVAPSLEEMQAIRKAAGEREDIQWDDALFFEVPQTETVE